MKPFLTLMIILSSFNGFAQAEEMNIKKPAVVNEAMQDDVKVQKNSPVNNTKSELIKSESLPAELQEAPPRGLKVVPPEVGIDNPFYIGPYEDGEYQYTDPDRDPDET